MELFRKIIRKIKEGMLQEMFLEARWMYQYARRYKASIIFYIVLGITSTIMGLGASVASKYLIDAVTGHHTDGIGFIIFIILALSFGSILIRAITSRISAKINIRVHNEIQADVYDKILDTDWESMSGFHSGDLLNRLNGDVSTVSGSVLGWIPGLIIGLVQFSGALAIILYFDSTMAVLALLSAPVMLIVSKSLMTKMRKFNKRMREVSSDLMAFNEESFQNVQSIKAFDLIGIFSQRLRKVQGNYASVSLEYNKFSIFTSSFMSVLGLAVSYATFGWAVYRLWGGHITFGTMTLFLQLASSLSASFSSLVGMVPSAISATTSAGRVMDVVELPRENKESERGSLSVSGYKVSEGLSIELSGVDFGYKACEKILEDVYLCANPGEIVALVGPSGEGKTTMVRILLGLLNVSSGNATIKDGGGFLSEISASTRQLFAYVPQEKSIFSGTIADNMRMVKPQATEEEIREALKAACALEFIDKLPEGINSRVGERGSGFSEGQGQRISIARALLRKSPILLLDEATSALDVATERDVLRNIMSAGYARTCIVTTHRPSVLTMCNRVYRISHSEVREISCDEIEKMIMEF